MQTSIQLRFLKWGRKWWTENNCLFYYLVDIMYHQHSSNKFNTFCFSASLTLINAHTICWQGWRVDRCGGPGVISRSGSVRFMGRLRSDDKLSVSGSCATGREEMPSKWHRARPHTSTCTNLCHGERCHGKHSLLEERGREDTRASSAAGDVLRSLSTAVHNTNLGLQLISGWTSTGDFLSRPSASQTAKH